jgi:hypothetical protein
MGVVIVPPGLVVKMPFALPFNRHPGCNASRIFISGLPAVMPTDASVAQSALAGEGIVRRSVPRVQPPKLNFFDKAGLEAMP